MDPSRTCLFIPPELKKFKLDLFERIGRHISSKGGSVIRGDFQAVANLPVDVVPIVGCSPQLTPTIKQWKAEGRDFIYWDRGYARRVFATWLPKGDNGGFYRWHLNSFQMTKIIPDVKPDRWEALKVKAQPNWRQGGKHIVIAVPTLTYQRFHDIYGWTDRTIRELALLTDRQLVVRDKETKRPLQQDLEGAHCLVSHGSIAAVEAAILGYPVIVDSSSAAALVGRTDLKRVESLAYPPREPWLWSLAYCQFDESELVSGKLWELLH